MQWSVRTVMSASSLHVTSYWRMLLGEMAMSSCLNELICWQLVWHLFYCLLYDEHIYIYAFFFPFKSLPSPLSKIMESFRELFLFKAIVSMYMKPLLTSHSHRKHRQALLLRGDSSVWLCRALVFIALRGHHWKKPWRWCDLAPPRLLGCPSLEVAESAVLWGHWVKLPAAPVQGTGHTRCCCSRPRDKGTEITPTEAVLLFHTLLKKVVLEEGHSY